MKKNILIYSFTIFFIYLLFNNQQLIVNAVINSSILFLTKVLPFFLPMYIISKILINYNFPVVISKLIKSFYRPKISLHLTRGSSPLTSTSDVFMSMSRLYNDSVLE